MYLTSIDGAKAVSYVATLFCVLFTVRVAAVYTAQRARLFYVLAMFALAWALLLVYYSGNDPQSEMLPAFGGFLLVYMGALMRHNGRAVRRLERVALWVFAILACPSMLTMWAPEGLRMGLEVGQIELIVATVLNLLGFASIVVGTRALCGRRWALAMLAVVLPYGGVEVSYTIHAFPLLSDSAAPLMTVEYYYAFAIAKVILTVMFVYCVANHRAGAAEPRKSPIDFLIGLAR